MTTIKPFSIWDTLTFNSINLDVCTQTFNPNFYGKYIAKWPEYCHSLLGSKGNSFTAYILGKVQGKQENQSWHGHVTAITVAYSARRQGLGRLLMDLLQQITERHKGFFVDLFVRPSNTIAVKMYKNFGYDVYRTVYRYYSSSQDAYDMRKSMSRDNDKKLSKPTGKTIKPEQLQYN